MEIILTPEEFVAVTRTAYTKPSEHALYYVWMGILALRGITDLPMSLHNIKKVSKNTYLVGGY